MADDAAAPEGELTKAGRKSGAVDPESEAVEPAATEEETTGTDDVVEADEADDFDDLVEDDGEVAPARRPMSHVKMALIAGIAGVVALAGLTGWLGYRAYESSQAEAQRNLFLQVGRQGALNLTTINHENAEADVQRILDSATGTFYDDFQQRAQPFVEVVKQAQSKSEGTIAEAGLESSSESEAQVLVAVTVQTTNAGAPEQEPRAWRMRLLVEQVGDEAKVSNVEFVP
ncbi:tetratricopeptide repeat protein [Mycolicibacterium hippocampi]|uniref:Mce associated membrane protein n=1 Tax=Mycolicibacterium hippocampi TaxID=659824 RepID=A0A7I9ZUW5_9MYCO|nr:tetratricopeptide repeat protein [Mycolicibacterium hippocampi]GFH04734.1 hypothetical protein MHIP_52170 [Mycolicibacterium hippocampi]